MMRDILFCHDDTILKKMYKRMYEKGRDIGAACHETK